MEQPPSFTTSPRCSKRSRNPTSPVSIKKQRLVSSNDATTSATPVCLLPIEKLHETSFHFLQNCDIFEKKSFWNRLVEITKNLRHVKDQMSPKRCAGIETSVFPPHFTQSETTCIFWSNQLSLWTQELVEMLEQEEVKTIVRDMVAAVERKTLCDELYGKHMEFQWAKWFENDATNCFQAWDKDIQETNVFEVMEKQLINDRIVELETQLAQKRTVEKEKEMELSLLRADQEELIESSGVVLNTKLESLVAVKEAVDVEVKQLKERIKQQTQELVCGDEERVNLKLQNQKLVEEMHQLRAEQETKEVKTVQQHIKQEDEIKKLRAMLQTAKHREAKSNAVLEAAEKEFKKNAQRKEELKILYAKFSSAMDSVSAKTMRLEELEQELKDLQDIQKQNEQLEKEVAELQQEKADLIVARHREKEDMSEELVIVQKQLTELKELTSQQKELTSNLQSEVTELKGQNETLRKQKVKQEHQSVGQPSNESEKINTDSSNDLVIQVAEKEALQMFVQRYYSAAEDKCSRLLENVSELELQCKRMQEQTKESCSLLRMCAQADAFNESIRASLLDIMATLEGLT